MATKHKLVGYIEEEVFGDGDYYFTWIKLTKQENNNEIDLLKQFWQDQGEPRKLKVRVTIEVLDGD